MRLDIICEKYLDPKDNMTEIVIKYTLNDLDKTSNIISYRHMHIDEDIKGRDCIKKYIKKDARMKILNSLGDILFAD